MPWKHRPDGSRALVCMPPGVRREACVIHYCRWKVGTHSEIDGVEPDLISQVPEPAAMRIRRKSEGDNTTSEHDDGRSRRETLTANAETMTRARASSSLDLRLSLRARVCVCVCVCVCFRSVFRVPSWLRDLDDR